MKVVCISDTHGRHKKLNIPECDLLIHAGDLTPKGEIPMLESALNWLSKQPAKHIVFIAGNHDRCFQDNPNHVKNHIIDKLPFHMTYLEAGSYAHEDSVIVNGLKIWGSPWTPYFYNWAYNFPERDLGYMARKHWDMIPSDTDIVISHGPQHGILDMNDEGLYCGCLYLRDRLDIVKPKLHVFGHIHEAYGMASTMHTLHVNASVLDGDYQLANAPIVLDL